MQFLPSVPLKISNLLSQGSKINKLEVGPKIPNAVFETRAGGPKSDIRVCSMALFLGAQDAFKEKKSD